MIKKITKSDNYDIAYFPFPSPVDYIFTVTKSLQSNYNQERDEGLEFYKKIDNAILLSELCRGLEFYKSLIEKDKEIFSKYLLFDKSVIHTFGSILLPTWIEPAIDLIVSTYNLSSLIEEDKYTITTIGLTSLSLAKTKALKPIFMFDLKYLDSLSSSFSKNFESDFILLFSKDLDKPLNFQFMPSILFHTSLIKDYCDIESNFIEYDKALCAKYNQISDEDYAIRKNIDEILTFPIFQRGIDFNLPFSEKDILNYDFDLLYEKELNEDYDQIIHQDHLFSFSLIFDDSYVLDYIVPSILSLTKRKTFKPLFEIQSDYLTRYTIDTKINISRFQRGLEFSLDSMNSFDSNILSSMEFSDVLHQSLNYQLISNLLSSSSLELVPIITIPVALTTLSLAKTKIFSPSISFDNFLSSIDNLISSSHFQSDIESLLTSTISFDDIYTLWKITSLSFSKNINFEYNQTQDFEIDLDIAQLLSKLITIAPSVTALRIALKEILTFAKQIEVLAITKQITVTTTVK